MALRCPNTSSVCQGIAWPYAKYGLPVRYPLTAFWNMYWDTAANGLYTSHFMYGSSTGSYSLVAFYSALHTPVDFAIGMDGNEVFSSSQITGRWARQAVRSYISGGTTYCDYFYDLPDLSKVIQTSTANAPPSLNSNFAITIGANNWTDFEGLDGRFSERGHRASVYALARKHQAHVIAIKTECDSRAEIEQRARQRAADPTAPDREFSSIAIYEQTAREIAQYPIEHDPELTALRADLLVVQTGTTRNEQCPDHAGTDARNIATALAGVIKPALCTETVG